MKYTDRTGRQWVTLVPEWEDNPSRGIPVGPPDTSSLGLPKAVDIRLNNQLVARGLLTLNDVRHRPQELFAALQAAYKVDTAKLSQLFT